MSHVAAAANSTSAFVETRFGTITAVHLVVMAVFALLVLVAILYGIRSKHRRVQAERTVVENAVEAGVPVVDADDGNASLPADPEVASPAVSERETRPVADEPIVAAAPLDASPAVEAASAPTAPLHAGPAVEAAPAPTDAPASGAGPVTLLKGLGPKVAARLGELGITDVGQIAALSDDEADRLDAQLGPFRGRMARDRWIEQARFLAAGDRAGFEAVFGKL